MRSARLGLVAVLLLGTVGCKKVATEMAEKNHEARLEAERKTFIDGCLKKVDSQDYCTCGFEQFKLVFKDADLNEKPSSDRLAALKKRSADACATKLGEDKVKASFLSACVAGGDVQKKTYCNCAWGSLRKRIELSDFMDDAPSDRLKEAESHIKEDCASTLTGK